MHVFFELTKNCVRCSMPAWSRLLVGSSSSNKSASCISADASKSRACCPPENARTFFPWSATKCTASSTLSIRGSMSYTLVGKHDSKNSRTVMSSCSLGITWRAWATFKPCVMCTTPDSGVWAPVMMSSRVLLPAPFWPMMVFLVPRRTEKLTSFKIGLLCP